MSYMQYVSVSACVMKYTVDASYQFHGLLTTGRAPSYLHRSEDGFSFQQNSYLDSLHGAAEKEVS